MSFMLSVSYKPFILSVVMLNVNMLNAIMLNVNMLIVIMLSVVAPLEQLTSSELELLISSELIGKIIDIQEYRLLNGVYRLPCLLH